MNIITAQKAFDFVLPESLECTTPTEERGLRRDDVRLMVSNRTDNSIAHSTFKNIASFLQEGDVLIVNTSRTRNAALPTLLPGDLAGRIHLSTPLNHREWLVEVRQINGKDTSRYHGLSKHQVLSIPAGGIMEVIEPYYDKRTEDKHIKLWKVRFSTPIEISVYLKKYGQPIKYKNIDTKYPLSYYQTVFSSETGSSEMPSAGRAFTPELVTKLVLKGVQFAPVILHTGISSLEIDEAPYPEYFEVAPFTASLINRAKAENRRIIAVGTTAIRAIESAINLSGKVISKSGMTNLFITPERGLQIVNAMLTGFHEPKASHLLMMEALADKSHLAITYQSAIEAGYYWHEFGDLHLLL